jgi:hypothetical protein
MIDINKEYLKCYKYYDHKFRKLAIYGKYDHNSQRIKIYILTLSTKERDNRKLADSYFRFFLEGDQNEVSPLIFRVPATDNTYKQEFFSFLKKNYWRMDEIAIGLMNSKQLIYARVFKNQYETKIQANSLTLIKLDKQL